MTAKQIFEHFGDIYPLETDALARFNDAFVVFDAFLDFKWERLKSYANKPDANPVAVESGNYEIAKCYEFVDTIWDALRENLSELEREAIYMLYVKMFGPQQYHGKELQFEINKLKVEIGL